jgi:hypothetical protein
MKKFILIVSLIFFSSNFLVAQNKSEEKKEQAKQAYLNLKNLIELGKFSFEADWAIPQQGNQINLISNPNFFKIDGDNADIFFPYFGVAQQIPYGSNDLGIQFKGIIKDYKVKFNDKKQTATLKFSAKNKTENYIFSLTVYKNNNTSVTVHSNYRSSIQYTGKIKELEKQ